VITRVLGTDPEVEVDAFSIATKPGDLFVLCSDGLTSMVDDARILAVLEQHPGDVKAAAHALIDEANASGGEDNITVVLFQIASLDDTIELPGMLLDPDPDTTPVDEDTLSGLEPVPVAAQPSARTAAAPAVVAQLPKRRRRWRIAIPLTVALLAVLAGLAVFGLSRANFVGADKNGYVAVYQGVPWNLPLGIHLYREVYVSRLLTAELSQPERRKLFDHTLRSRSSAEQLVKRYGRYVVGAQ
jgi:PPM family protein phosphatase